MTRDELPEEGGGRVAKHLLIVMSNANEGQDDEFNDWYTNTHLGDIIALDGFTQQ